MTGHADGAETNKTGIDPYDRNAAALAEMYESAMFETVHEAVRNLLFDSPVAVLDVGAGSGWDASWFAERGHDVVAVEPSAAMRSAAAGAVAEASRAGLPVDLLEAVGEDLPLADNSVDAVLLAYVMCTVDDPARVVREVDRVLRPGGIVGVLEHVADEDGTWMRRAQRLASPWWPWVAGGCHCDRDTRTALEAGGFDTGDLRRESLVNVPPALLIVPVVATF